MRRAKDCRKCRVRNIFPTQKCSERTAAHTRSAVPALDYLPSRCCFHRLAHGANSSLPSSRAVLMCRGRALPSAGSEARQQPARQRWGQDMADVMNSRCPQPRLSLNPPSLAPPQCQFPRTRLQPYRNKKHTTAIGRRNYRFRILVFLTFHGSWLLKKEKVFLKENQNLETWQRGAGRQQQMQTQSRL